MSFIEEIVCIAERYRLLRLSLCVYLFLLPFQRFSGARNAAFAPMLVLLVIGILRARDYVFLRDRTVYAFWVLVAVILLNSALSPYPAESFDFIRKNLLYQAAVFMAVVYEFRGMADLRPVLYSLAAGFASLSALIIAYNGPHAVLHWLDNKNLAFMSGYSLSATFFVPLILGHIYSTEERPRIRALLFVLVVVMFVMSVFNNHRTQMMAIGISVAVIMLLAKKHKTFAACVLFAAVAAIGVFIAHPGALDRYKTLFSPQTYITDQDYGWNGRYVIWTGTWDMIQERPVTGWGYGWKKLATVADERGYMDKWEKTKPATFAYFKNSGYGSANPHNLILQVLFEVGVVGLAALSWFWATVIKKSIDGFRRLSTQGHAERFLRYAVPGVFVSYMIVNISNGLWEEIAGNLMAAFAAMTVVAWREHKNLPAGEGPAFKA